MTRMQYLKTSGPLRALLVLCVGAALVVGSGLAGEALGRKRPAPTVTVDPILQEAQANADQIDDPRLCPTTEGLAILTSLHPPTSIFVGYDPSPSHRAFLNAVLDGASELEPRPEVVMLLPGQQVEAIRTDLQSMIDGPWADKITFLPTGAEETLWVQDYFEAAIDVQTSRYQLLDMPYPFASEDELPAAISLARRTGLVPQGEVGGSSEAFDEEADWVDSGNFGGNVEAFPGNLVLVGSTMTDATRKHLEKTLAQDFHIVSVEWLDTGHVDEIFALVPLATPKNGCAYAIAYASPAAAMTALEQASMTASLAPSVTDDREEWSASIWTDDLVRACLDKLAGRTPHHQQSDLCHDLWTANTIYNTKIERERELLAKKIAPRLRCQTINWIPLPQLFAPKAQQEQYGTIVDEARALNPNLVNLVVLGNRIILASQPHPKLASAAIAALRPTEQHLVFVPSTTVHNLGGGIHCASNMLRACQTPAQPSGPPPGRRAAP